MMRLLSLGILMSLVSLSVFAGGYWMNDTGETVFGLRVEFSEMVSITAFGDVLTAVEPTYASETFVFYGGAVEEWGAHWCNWDPAAAQVVSSEWLTEAPTKLADRAALASQTVEVVGDLLNPDYFTHPAYVIQGISNQEDIFAAPLDGVPEIDLHPTRVQTSCALVKWSVSVEDPSLVDASIEDGTLYVWASTKTSTGVTSVTLCASLEDEDPSYVVIPVIVFGSDRTLSWFSGEKDYFVPWSPQLDINRILSVEEHVTQYGKDEGFLDRSIQWSRWKPMPYLRDATISTLWPMDLYKPGAFWPIEAQIALVDVQLAELRDVGFDTIRSKNLYYSFGLTGTEFQPVYDNFNAGVSKRPEVNRYIVNEAHRLGLNVMMSTVVGIDMRSTDDVYYEPWQSSPEPIEEYWENYYQLMMQSMEEWQELGVDIASIAESLELVPPRTAANMAKTSDAFVRIAEDSRELYEGPLTCYTSCQWLPGQYVSEAPFWSAVDILCPAINDDYKTHVDSFDASVEELAAAWERLINGYFQPFQQEYNKPLMAWHAGCFPLDGSATWGVQFNAHYSERLSQEYLDLEEQRRWYEAAITSFDEMEGFRGFGAFWYHLYYPMLGGVHDVDLSPRLKPAEWFLAEHYGGTATLRPIRIDGDASDWSEKGILIEDTTGDDLPGGDDLLWVRVTQDDMYLYLALQYSATPQGGLSVWLDLQDDGQWDSFVGVGPAFSWYDQAGWIGHVHRSSNPDQSAGAADVTVSEGFVELRLNRRYIDEHAGPIGIRITDAHATWTADDDAIPYWTTVPAP